MSANHEDCKFLLGNQLIEAKRGDVITSEVKLMDRWGWSKTKVRAFLDLLENDSMLVKKADNKKTTLTLVNYSVWQDSQTAKEPEKDREETSEEPLSYQLETGEEPLPDTINNSNNSNNSNNDISSCPANKFADDVIEFILASELYGLILANNPKVKKPNLQAWAKSFDLMIRRDNRSVADIRDVMNWCQGDSFWHRNILSPDKLREKFDQLTLKMNSSYQKKEDHNGECRVDRRNFQSKRKPWEPISEASKKFFDQGFED
jgi:hypothetical protein